MYSEFACIVDYLILIYGKEKLILYIRKLSNNPDNNKEFKKVYGLEFSKAIQNFNNIVNANKKQI